MKNRTPVHCPLCAARLLEALVEGVRRSRCSACSFVLYLNPASAAAGVVLGPDSRVLLVQRAIEPHRGAWALPAGYQEIHESPEEAVMREVHEEAGVRVQVVRLLDLVYVPDDPRKPANVAFYLCHAESLELAPGSDATDAGWFPLDELPEPFGFENNRRILARLTARGRYSEPPGFDPQP